MSTVYKNKDLSVFNKRIAKIVGDIEDEKLDKFEPTRAKMEEINRIVLAYIKEHGRKIYGGYSQDMLIHQRNPTIPLKKIHELDIDFYSPDPIKDLIALENTFFDKGFKFLYGKNAIHGETFKLFVNQMETCDISYVPKNIYNSIKFIKVDGILYTHPEFMMIDLYKIITDKYFSSFRWEKSFRRLFLLHKYYSIPTLFYKSPLDQYLISYGKHKQDSTLDKINVIIVKWLQDNKDTIMLMGNTIFNWYYRMSGIDKSHDRKYKNIKMLPITSYIVSSMDYSAHTEALLSAFMKVANKDNSNI